MTDSTQIQFMTQSIVDLQQRLTSMENKQFSISDTITIVSVLIALISFIYGMWYNRKARKESKLLYLMDSIFDAIKEIRGQIAAQNSLPESEARKNEVVTLLINNILYKCDLACCAYFEDEVILKKFDLYLQRTVLGCFSEFEEYVIVTKEEFPNLIRYREERIHK